jgi:hypothetical protein
LSHVESVRAAAACSAPESAKLNAGPLRETCPAQPPSDKLCRLFNSTLESDWVVDEPP